MKLKMKDSIQVLQNYNTRGFQSSIEPCYYLVLAKRKSIDHCTVSWPDGKTQILTNVKSDQTITLKNSDALHSRITHIISASKPMFEEVEQKLIEGDAVHHEDRYNDFNDEILLIRMLSTEGPRLIRGDVNKDNLDDFILLGAAGDPCKLFIQKQAMEFPVSA